MVRCNTPIKKLPRFILPHCCHSCYQMVRIVTSHIQKKYTIRFSSILVNFFLGKDINYTIETAVIWMS